MNSVGFHTLQAANALQEAGIERPHAEAIAQVVGLRTGDYGTKAGLTALEARLEAKIAAVDAKVDALAARVDTLDAKVDALEGKIRVMIDAKVEQAKNVILRTIVAAGVAIVVTLIGGIFAIISAV